MKLLLFVLLLPFVSAKTVYLFGDSITQDLKNYNFNPFNPSDNVQNYARSAFDVELVHLIIDPYRNMNRLTAALQENTVTKDFFPNQVIVPNIQANPPDVIFIMVGLRNLLVSEPIHDIVYEYQLLLNKLEMLLPKETIILVASVLPVDNNIFVDSYRELLLGRMREYNSLLKYEVSIRNKLNYHYINLFDAFMDGNRASKTLLLQQGDALIHPSLQGYQVWKNKLGEIFEEEFNPIAIIRTQHWDHREHRNYFQLFINDQFVGSFFEFKEMSQTFVIGEEKITKIEVVLTSF